MQWTITSKLKGSNFRSKGYMWIHPDNRIVLCLISVKDCIMLDQIKVTYMYIQYVWYIHIYVCN